MSVLLVQESLKFEGHRSWNNLSCAKMQFRGHNAISKEQLKFVSQNTVTEAIFRKFCKFEASVSMFKITTCPSIG